MQHNDQVGVTPRKYTDITLDEVEVQLHAGMIALAEDGNVKAAQTLMADASVLLQYGRPLPEPLGTYIGEALYKAALFDSRVGLRPDEAFHIKMGRDRNKYNELFKAHLICMEVQLKWFSVNRYETSRNGELGAYELVAEKYRYNDPDSVRKLFQKYHGRWGIKDQSIDQLQETVPVYRKLFSRTG